MTEPLSYLLMPAPGVEAASLFDRLTLGGPWFVDWLPRHISEHRIGLSQIISKTSHQIGEAGAISQEFIVSYNSLW